MSLEPKHIKKWMKKPNQHQKFQNMDEIANFG
jgi:hypothetical protein